MINEKKPKLFHKLLHKNFSQPWTFKHLSRLSHPPLLPSIGWNAFFCFAKEPRHRWALRLGPQRRLSPCINRCSNIPQQNAQHRKKKHWFWVPPVCQIPSIREKLMVSYGHHHLWALPLRKQACGSVGCLRRLVWSRFAVTVGKIKGDCTPNLWRLSIFGSMASSSQSGIWSANQSLKMEVLSSCFMSLSA